MARLSLLFSMTVLFAACGSREPPAERNGAANQTSASSNEQTKPSPAQFRKLSSKGWGSIRGKVVFDGDPPRPINLIPQMMVKGAGPGNPCLKGKTEDETWVVGPDKGVANVIVWLRAPKGTYFDVPEKQQKREDTVSIGQPFCAFEPHVTALYASYYDGKAQKPTGQKFKVVNDGTFPHNTNLQFSTSAAVSTSCFSPRSRRPSRPASARPAAK